MVDFADVGRGVNAGLAVRRNQQADRRLDLFEEESRQRQARADAEAARQEAQRQQQNALDEAIRRGASQRLENEPPSSRAQPMLRELTSVPGGGPMAANILSADDERRDSLQREALQAAAEGNVAMFELLRGQSGLKIPPQIEQNVQLRARYAQAMLLAEQFYKDDPERGAGLVRLMVQNPEIDAATALQQAGDPRRLARPATPSFHQIEVLDADGNTVIGSFDERTGRVTIPQGARGAFGAPASSQQQSPLQRVTVQGEEGPVLATFDPNPSVSGPRVQIPTNLQGQPFGVPDRSRGAGSAKAELIRVLVGYGMAETDAISLATSQGINPDAIAAETYRSVIAAFARNPGFDPADAQANAMHAANQVRALAQQAIQLEGQGVPQRPSAAPTSTAPAPAAPQAPAAPTGSRFRYTPGQPLQPIQ